jgi:VWFA-related protein
MRVVTCLGAILVGAMGTLASAAGQEQGAAAPSGPPTFRSGVEMVTVTAVVRDQKGRLVRTLKRDQFQVLDRGEVRTIREFRPEAAPVSVAMLLDVSGSMSIASNLEAAKQATSDILACLGTAKDEFALFTFDSRLDEVQAFSSHSTDKSDLRRKLDEVAAFGMTSLHDAIAETARRVAARANGHRAVVVLTDGVDNRSHMTAGQVAGIASAIDVPVYILAVVSPLDHPTLAASVAVEYPNRPAGNLADLAAWTGGGLFISSKREDSLAAAQGIVAELRHQYLLAFEPGHQPGWHPLEIRVRDRKLSVRARSGYMAGAPRQGTTERAPDSH